jgi:hypothetical protein
MLSASHIHSLQVTTCYKLAFRRGKLWSWVDHVMGNGHKSWWVGKSDSAWMENFTVSINSNSESRRKVNLLQALDSCELSLCELTLCFSVTVVIFAYMVHGCWELCLHALTFSSWNYTTATSMDYSVHNCSQCLISCGLIGIQNSVLQFQSVQGCLL